ncbi:hypothetical protein ACFO3E_10235, partial [Sphingobium tyrosinilyticum]
MPPATPTENIDGAPLISFPAIHRKKVTAAFDGGRLTSDGGVLLLAQAERTMGIPTNPLRANPDIVAAADACAVKRAEQDRVVLRCYAEIR